MYVGDYKEYIWVYWDYFGAGVDEKSFSRPRAGNGKLIHFPRDRDGKREFFKKI